MYKYEFVQIDIKSGLLGAKPEQDYHKTIDEYSDRDWRLVQVVSLYGGYSSGIELIFEKEIE